MNEKLQIDIPSKSSPINKANSELPRAGLSAPNAPALLGGAEQVAAAQSDKESLGFTHFRVSVVTLDGSSGLNFLQMSPNETPMGNTLDLTRSSVLSRVKSFSSIDLTATINNTIKLNWAAVAILSDAFDTASLGGGSARMLVVSGNPGDVMQLVNLNSWSVGAVQTAEALSTAHGHGQQFLAGHAYKAYSLFGATVFVDDALEVHDASVHMHAQVKSQVFSIDQLFALQAPVTEGSFALDDPTGSFKGVAIVFAGTGGAHGDITTTGHYELSKDGGASWMSVGGDLSHATAVYADKSALLRFVGAEDADRLQPQNLMVRLIDDSGWNGLANYGPASTGSIIDVSAHGESMAFGAEPLHLQGRASKPMLSIPQEQPPNGADTDDFVPVGVVGSPVSSLFGWDDSQGEKGIAITGVDMSQGTLYYSTNGGNTWTEVTRPLSAKHALFIRSDADNRVYFKPNTGSMVRSEDALTIRAWDQSQETETIFFISTDEGLNMPEAATSLEAEDALSDVSSVQDNRMDELAPATPLEACHNRSYNLNDKELNALGWMNEGVAQKPDVNVTPEDLAAAIAISVNASMAKVYAMPQSDDLDLRAMLGHVQIKDLQSESNALVKASVSELDLVQLTMADVMRLPATNGVHQLVLTGAVNDKLVLSKGEWTDTGTVVTQDGHTYAVYAGSSDASAQLLIDQQMLHSLLSS